jgi:hypothetical protein
MKHHLLAVSIGALVAAIVLAIGECGCGLYEERIPALAAEEVDAGLTPDAN